MKRWMLMGVVALLTSSFTLGCASSRTAGAPGPAVAPPAAAPPPAPTTVELKPAAATRSRRIASFVVAPPGQTIAAVSALARGIGLPMDPGVMLGAAAPWVPSALAALDPARGLGGAYLSDEPKGSWVVALACKGPPQVAELRNILRTHVFGAGKPMDPTRTRADAEEYVAGGSQVWLLARGAQLYLASTFEALGDGAALAVEGQVGATAALSFTLFLDAPEVRKGIEVARQGMGASLGALARGDGKKAPDQDLTAFAGVIGDWLFGMAGQVVSFDLALAVDPERGLTFISRLRPVADSAMARAVATPAPFAIDPALFTAGPPVALFAVGPTAFFIDSLSQAIGRSDRASAPLLAGFKEIFENVREFYGLGYSGTLSLGRGGLKADFVNSVRPGVGAQAVLDAQFKLVTSPLYRKFLGAGTPAGSKPPQVQARRGKDSLTFSVPMTSADMPPEAAKMVKTWFGERWETVMVARGETIYSSSGPDATRRSKRLAAAGAGSPGPEVKPYLDAAAGADGFAYVDLMALILPVLEGAGEKKVTTALAKVPGARATRLPLIFDVRGGGATTFTLRIPRETLAAAMGLAPVVGGAMAR